MLAHIFDKKLDFVKESPTYVNGEIMNEAKDDKTEFGISKSKNKFLADKVVNLKGKLIDLDFDLIPVKGGAYFISVVDVRESKDGKAVK